ncbi:hypothetical protein LPJ64_005921 [Coemansia asiatica]|uniref:Uncharacterized protein n=1 Tax=Coemansia asiatica TaxID=1052880 RepID=A0A9W7XG69_9FUNG|nr:hypothetical protein LPJ64_005921 [Coemansia asiatica]
MYKRTVSLLAFAALSFASVLPLHPRAAASPAPTDQGLPYFETINDPDFASIWASRLINSLSAIEDEVLTEYKEPYESLVSAMHNSDIATNAVDIFDELTKFIDEVQTIPVQTPFDNRVDSAISNTKKSSQVEDDSADISEPDNESSGSLSNGRFTIGILTAGIAFSLAVLNVMSIHPRAESIAASDNLGLILSNAAAVIPDDSIANELASAGNSLIKAAD